MPKQIGEMIGKASLFGERQITLFPVSKSRDSLGKPLIGRIGGGWLEEPQLIDDPEKVIVGRSEYISPGTNAQVNRRISQLVKRAREKGLYVEKTRTRKFVRPGKRTLTSQEYAIHAGLTEANSTAFKEFLDGIGKMVRKAQTIMEQNRKLR